MLKTKKENTISTGNKTGLRPTSWTVFKFWPALQAGIKIDINHLIFYSQLKQIWYRCANIKNGKNK
jgi:hypothetical protein